MTPDPTISYHVYIFPRVATSGEYAAIESIVQPDLQLSRSPDWQVSDSVAGIYRFAHFDLYISTEALTRLPGMGATVSARSDLRHWSSRIKRWKRSLLPNTQ